MPGFHMKPFGQGLGMDACRPPVDPFDRCDRYHRYDPRFSTGYDSAVFGQQSGSPTGIQYFPLPPPSPFSGNHGGPLPPPSPAPPPQWLPGTLQFPLPQLGSPSPSHALSPPGVPSSPAGRGRSPAARGPLSPRFAPQPCPQKFPQAARRSPHVVPGKVGPRPPWEPGPLFVKHGCGHELCNRIRHSNPRSKKQASSHAGVLLMSCVRGDTATMLTRGPLENEIGYGLTAGSRILQDSDQGCYIAAARRMLQLDAGIPEEVSADRIAFKTFLRLCENSAAGTPVLIGFVSERDMLDLAARCPVSELSATRLFRISYNSARWRNVGDVTERRVSTSVRILAAQISSETMACS